MNARDLPHRALPGDPRYLDGAQRAPDERATYREAMRRATARHLDRGMIALAGGGRVRSIPPQD